MRYLGIALALIFSLSACNMTMGSQPSDHQNNEVVALSTNTPTTAQQPAPEQLSAPTQTPRPTSTTPPQSVAAAVLPSCTARTDWQIYTVASGDTLSQIAQRSGTDSGTLAAANCLRDANAISVGQALRVPSLPAPAPMNSNNTNPSTANLRMVGDFAGRPGLESCWASTKEGHPLVYDRVDGTPIAYVSNRVPVISATSTWVQVHLNGTMTIPETTGWMRVSDIRLIGFCTEATGVQLASFRGEYFGNPAGIPVGLCVVAALGTKEIRVYDAPNGHLIGEMIGWANWVSTEGNFYQFEAKSWVRENSPTFFAYVDASTAEIVNC